MPLPPRAVPPDGSETASATAKSHVVLFKTYQEDAHRSDEVTAKLEDPYKTILDGAGYTPHFVRVLEEVYHLQELVSTLTSQPVDVDMWEGVIVSSKRGTSAWIQAVEIVMREDSRSPSSSQVQKTWEAVRLYCVGQSSLDTFQAQKRKYEAEGNEEGLRYLPSGDETRVAKSARELVPIVLADPARHVLPPPHASRHGGEEAEGNYRPYLVIRGDKSTEELANALVEAGRQVHQITVYSTSPASDLEADIEQMLNDIPPPRERRLLWLAFFSPSSASYALEYIPKDLLRSPSTRIFAIGETTKAYLHERGMDVHAVADEPTPQGLLDAIQQAQDQ